MTKPNSVLYDVFVEPCRPKLTNEQHQIAQELGSLAHAINNLNHLPLTKPFEFERFFIAQNLRSKKMALAFNIDEATFNGLESQVQGLYTKTDDGNYQLAIDGLPDTKGLKAG